MEYRILRPEEWERLHEIMEDQFIPHPDTASVAIAEDKKGNIVGCLFLQLALHMEPLVLKSADVSFKRLHDVLYKAVEVDKGLHIFVFSNKEIVDRMAAHVGMRQLDYKVFEQVVK
jgi:hypothetical protein